MERSTHGGDKLFDSFSESCNGGSRDPSRRGANNRSTHGPSAHALASRLQQHIPWRRGGAAEKCYSKSLNSGTEFYRKLQRQQSCETDATSSTHATTQLADQGHDDESFFTYFFPDVEDSASFTPRWAHSAAALGDRMYVYGGLAAMDRPLSGLYVFSFATNQWRSLAAHVAKADILPPPMWGHAMAAASGKIWLVGGRVKGHRRGKTKLQNQGFCLDTETLTWSAVPVSNRGYPPAFAEGTLTDCGSHGVVAFGGNTGKKSATAALHLLNPATGIWKQLSTSGVAPEARAHHTAVWDGDDYLVVFGGTSAGGTSAVASTVHVLDLGRRKWLQPAGVGGASEGPCPRAQHCASMVGWGNPTMAVIGGTGVQGELLNDVWLLRVGTTWEWRQGVARSARPTGRRGASCALVAGSRVALCGGFSANGPLDSVVLLSTHNRPQPVTPEAGPGVLISTRRQLASSGLRSAQVAERCQTLSDSPKGVIGSSRCLRDSVGESLSDQTDSSQTSKATQSHTDWSRHSNINHSEATLEVAQKLLAEERAATAALRAQVSDLQTLAGDRDTAAADALAALKEEAAVDSRAVEVAHAQAAAASSRVKELEGQLAAAAVAAEGRLLQAFAASAAREDSAVAAAASARGQAAALARRCGDLSRRLNLVRTAHITGDGTPKSRPPLARQATYPLGFLQLAHIEEGGEGEEEGGLDLKAFRTEQESAAGSVNHKPILDPTAAAASQLPAVRAVPAGVQGGSSNGTLPHQMIGSTSLQGAIEVPDVEEAVDSAFNRWCGSPSQPQLPPQPTSPSIPRTATQLGDLFRKSVFVNGVGVDRNGAGSNLGRISPSATSASSATDRVRALELQVACLQGRPGALAACNPQQLQELHSQLSSACAAVRRAAAQRVGKGDPLSCPLCAELPLQVVFGCGHQVCEECSLLKCPIQCPFCYQTIAARIPMITP